MPIEPTANSPFSRSASGLRLGDPPSGDHAEDHGGGGRDARENSFGIPDASAADPHVVRADDRAVDVRRERGARIGEQQRAHAVAGNRDQREREPVADEQHGRDPDLLAHARAQREQRAQEIADADALQHARHAPVRRRRAEWWSSRTPRRRGGARRTDDTGSPSSAARAR